MLIALVPQHAERMRPPRALAVPFELGRPLGKPDDPAFQRRVLKAALSLLTQTGKPVMSYFTEEVAQRESDQQGWSCPVSFPGASEATTVCERVTAEARLLQPWFDKGIEHRGYTSFGLTGLNVEEVIRFLAGFLEDPVSAAVIPPFGLHDSIKHAAEDLKTFYNEAATAQPGHASATEIADWYWGESAAGRLVREVRTACLAHPDSLVRAVGGFVLVPVTQVFRDEAAAARD